MRAVLILPREVNLTSGTNPIIVGDIKDGGSKTVNWAVLFLKNGTYTVQVQASGYDSNGMTCTMSRSKTITVSESSPLPWEFYTILVAVGIILALAVAVLLTRQRRRRAGTV